MAQTLPTLSPDIILNALLQDRNSAQSMLAKQLVTLGDANPEVQVTRRLLDTNNDQITARVDGILKAMRTELTKENAAAAAIDTKLQEAKTNDLENTARTRPYYLAKARLDELRRFEEVLFFRTGQDKMDVKMPTEKVVEIIEHAEANPIARCARTNL